ncbi:MAG: hypothetical protein JJT78_17130 [Leptospira sp.]|nr:hypothetical protein [Leptospira sp.]
MKYETRNQTFPHELCFEAANLEAMQEFLIEKNVPIINPLAEQPWGQMVIRIDLSENPYTT